MTRTEAFSIARHWDAGESGCGQLVVGLKHHVQQVPEGEFLQVTARDAGAPVDLPAWCRMTGHRLVFTEHPNYVVARRGM